MKLAEKGRFAPPPTLKGAPAQSVSETIASWEGVHARTHWLLGDEREVDGADFHVGELEIGHIHLDSEAHVFVSKALAAELVKLRLGAPFQWSGQVVVFGIDSKHDIDHALWLFRLSYDGRRGASEEALSKRVSEYVRAATKAAARPST